LISKSIHLKILIMTDFVAILMDMGFEHADAKKAVEATGNTDVQSAMEWILKNKAEQAPSDSGAPSPNGASKPPETEEVKSYKCNECEKIFRNAEEMEVHAARTKHVDFSESTEEKRPLTEEEKKEQFRLIEEKLKVKRAEREAREKKEALESEKNRMKSGKELAEYKRKFEEQQMKELAEARRQEKIDDRMARERIKALIAADRQARKDKDAGVTTEAASSSSSVSSLPSPGVASKPSQDEPPPKKDFHETKLQIRLPNGKAMVNTFNAKESLAAVRLYVQLHRDDGIPGDAPFNLMTNFPKKTFQETEYDMPLDVLGLAPTAVLIVTKTV
jgi:hypothetical protein